MAKSVAVLGTGIMGLPMARNLAKAGLEVRAWNRTREKAEPLADDGVTVAGSAAGVVVTMLADGDAVKQVAEEALGEAGDALWLQTSTVGLAATRELAELAERSGTAFVDSPVLGTKAPAEQGELVVLASGPEDVRDAAAPVFDAIGKKTLWLGEAGAGTRMKLVLNMWLLSLTAALGESIALAEALGADPATFLEILDGAPMGTPTRSSRARPSSRTSSIRSAFRWSWPRRTCSWCWTPRPRRPGPSPSWGAPCRRCSRRPSSRATATRTWLPCIEPPPGSAIPG